MGEINLERSEQEALASICSADLDRLISISIQQERIGELRYLPLQNCGTYVATRLHYFEQALERYSQSKSSRKRSETEYSLRRAGSDLSFAFDSMKDRLQKDLKEAELFYVDDHILSPSSLCEKMGVRIDYRWRKSNDADWTLGSITFEHEYRELLDLTQIGSVRKPSPSKQSQARQNRLYDTWEHLKRTALYSVRDYFKQGGDGDKIPKTFRAIADRRSLGLNNMSCIFWEGTK